QLRHNAVQQIRAIIPHLTKVANYSLNGSDRAARRYALLFSAHAAVARSEARHADQPLDLSLLHCGDEPSRRFGEKSRRLEDGFESGRNAERLDDDISSGQRVLHRGEPERVAGHFFQLGVVKTNSSG